MAQIAREEQRHPQTVAAIVKTEDQEKFIQEQQEKLFGFTDKAMACLDRALGSDPHGRLAFNLLKHLGIIPNPNKKQEGAQRPVIDVNAPENEQE